MSKFLVSRIANVFCRGNSYLVTKRTGYRPLLSRQISLWIPVDKKVDITYKKIRPNTIPSAVEFLFKNFVEEEPINKAFNIKPCNDLRNIYTKYMETGYCFAAYNTQKEIIGVTCNTPREILLDLVIEDPRVENCFVTFMKTLERNVDWSLINPSGGHMRELNIVSVAKEYRGGPIAQKLYDHTLEAAHENQWNALISHSSSPRSYVHFKRNGFIDLKRISFKELNIESKEGDSANLNVVIVGKRIR